MILTEEEESERRQEEFRSRSQMFIDGLDVDDVLAHLLVTEGFSSIEEVAFVPIEDLLSIEGFDEDIAEELRTRANNFLSEEEERLATMRRELGVDDELAVLAGLTPAMVVTLGEAGIKTLDDLGDLATDELNDPGNREGEGRGILAEYGLDEDQANAIIMAARAHWFDDEDAPAAEEPAEAAAEEPASTEEV
jgi:N utilization substance protein A